MSGRSLPRWETSDVTSSPATPRIDAVRRWLASDRQGDIDWPPDPPPRPVPFLMPRTAPPPERLKLVTRPDGRIRRARHAMTKALLRAGAIHRQRTSPPTTTAEERTA
jgi:hypothetical protein